MIRRGRAGATWARAWGGICAVSARPAAAVLLRNRRRDSIGSFLPVRWLKGAVSCDDRFRNGEPRARYCLPEPAQLPEIGFDLALELERHWFALAISCRAGGHADPAFADAIFLDIGFFGTVEFYANAFLDQC